MAEALPVDPRGLGGLSAMALAATLITGCGATQGTDKAEGLPGLGPVNATPASFSAGQRSLLSKLVTADDLTGWQLLQTPHAMSGNDCDPGYVGGVGSNLATTDSRHLVLAQSAQQFRDDGQAAKAAVASATFSFCGSTPTEGPLSATPHLRPYQVTGTPRDVRLFLSEATGYPSRVVFVLHRGRVMVRALLGWDDKYSSKPPDAEIQQIAAALHRSAATE